jgi:hypothetical protein
VIYVVSLINKFHVTATSNHSKLPPLRPCTFLSGFSESVLYVVLGSRDGSEFRFQQYDEDSDNEARTDESEIKGERNERGF